MASDIDIGKFSPELVFSDRGSFVTILTSCSGRGSFLTIPIGIGGGGGGGGGGGATPSMGPRKLEFVNSGCFKLELIELILTMIEQKQQISFINRYRILSTCVNIFFLQMLALIITIWIN